jgi:hypothetical protein
MQVPVKKKNNLSNELDLAFYTASTLSSSYDISPAIIPRRRDRAGGAAWLSSPKQTLLMWKLHGQTRRQGRMYVRGRGRKGGCGVPIMILQTSTERGL